MCYCMDSSLYEQKLNLKVVKKIHVQKVSLYAKGEDKFPLMKAHYLSLKDEEEREEELLIKEVPIQTILELQTAIFATVKS